MWFINIQYLHMQCLQCYILYICAIKEQYIFINQFDNSVFITHNLISTVLYGICYCDTAMSVTACAWSVENLQEGARIMYSFGSDVLMHMCLFAQTKAWTSFFQLRTASHDNQRWYWTTFAIQISLCWDQYSYVTLNLITSTIEWQFSSCWYQLQYP